MLELCFHPFPELETARLDLRRITPADADRLFELRSDPEVMKFIHRPLAQTITDAHQLIEKVEGSLAGNDGITWGIFKKGDSRLIGTIGFWRIEKSNYRAEIGYLLDAAAQGSGLMKEAISEVIRFGFKEMGLHSIEACVHPENDRSIRLLRNHGFVQEGLFRDNHFFEGKFYDNAVFSLLENSVTSKPEGLENTGN